MIPSAPAAMQRTVVSSSSSAEIMMTGMWRLLSWALRRQSTSKPLDPGVIEIEQYEVEILGSGQRERRNPAVGGSHSVSFAPQAAHQQIAIGEIVIDDKDVASDHICSGNHPRRPEA